MKVFAESEPEAVVRAYHRRSKHGFGTYAPGPGHLDWATQPDPFRRYAGAEQVPLPLTADACSVAWDDLFRPGAVSPRAPDREAIGILLELSFGLSAWKGYGGDRWALRCNPSSGNLHPTEVYVVAGHGTELESGVYHYQSHDHVLERRCRAEMPFAGMLVGLASIYWREAWKYGERAFRYCQHDAGHALAALRYAAGVLGWRVRLLDTWSDAEIAGLLGLDRAEDLGEAEAEAPDLICLIEWDLKGALPPATTHLVAAARAGSWQGNANRLSHWHLHPWPAIGEIHTATEKPATAAVHQDLPEVPALTSPLTAATAATLIRQRRSAQAFDGSTGLPARTLYRMLDATLPRPRTPPFDAWPWPPLVHLVLFVHRVEGLSPGLYLCCRHPDAEARLRAAIGRGLSFEPVTDRPPHLALFRLARADARQAARTLSCHQDIAADGAFSLGMLAEFDSTLRQEGPWAYRRLFRETGIIGQVLYLEAEAAGVRGTGIGCFFDDPVHELLGFDDERFQSLYHFTIGGPLVDRRLETLPPYGHLQGR